MTDTVLETNFAGLKFLRRGKVRDVYDCGENLLIVATDRLSAFDVVLPQPIPFKGRVLTQLSNYWFGLMTDIVPNHLVATDVRDFPSACAPYAGQLRGRSVLVKKTSPLPVECVARGYLAGSGWIEYQEHRTVCGIPLPEGLEESSPLPEPIFTPATKAEVGHDENIDFSRTVTMIGNYDAERVRDFTLKIYRRAVEIAAEKGIIIADTKMEFGLAGERLILIDELLTPDSSRFWPSDKYEKGKAQESFDKQFVRDYLISVNFDRKPPGPKLPEEVIRKTSELYLEALRKISGKDVE